MTPADLVRLRVTAKAESGSIQKIQQQLNALRPFNELAQFNGERALALLDKIDDTGLPMIEGWRRRTARAAGDPDDAEFLSVINTFQTEMARIITQPNLTGQLSDTARREVQDIAPASMSAAQGKRVINRLILEGTTREQFMQNQLQTASGQLVPGQTVTPPPVATPPGATSSSDGWGQATVVKP